MRANDVEEKAPAELQEERAFRLKTLSKRMCLTIGHLEDDVRAAIGVSMHPKAKGTPIFDSIYVLLDMAEECSHEMEVLATQQAEVHC